MKKIAFIASYYNEVEQIKKELSNKNIKNIDVFKYGTEPAGYDIIEYNVRPNKEYAEILDMAQLLSHHGFVDTDHYIPPEKGPSDELNKQFMEQALEGLKLDHLIAITDDDNLKPITKRSYEVEVERIKSNKTRLSEMSPRDLINKLEIEEDPVLIISIAVTIFAKIYGESYTASNGKEVKNFRTAGSVTWLSELWSELLPQQDRYHQKKYIKALKTRIKNMLKLKQSIWGIRFFIEFLIKEDSIELEPEETVYEVDGEQILDEDIPFSLLLFIPLLNIFQQLEWYNLFI